MPFCNDAALVKKQKTESTCVNVGPGAGGHPEYIYIQDESFTQPLFDKAFRLLSHVELLRCSAVSKSWRQAVNKASEIMTDRDSLWVIRAHKDVPWKIQCFNNQTGFYAKITTSFFQGEIPNDVDPVTFEDAAREMSGLEYFDRDNSETFDIGDEGEGIDGDNERELRNCLEWATSKWRVGAVYWLKEALQDSMGEHAVHGIAALRAWSATKMGAVVDTAMRRETSLKDLSGVLTFLRLFLSALHALYLRDSTMASMFVNGLCDRSECEESNMPGECLAPRLRLFPWVPVESLPGSRQMHLRINTDFRRLIREHKSNFYLYDKWSTRYTTSQKERQSAILASIRGLLQRGELYEFQVLGSDIDCPHDTGHLFEGSNGESDAALPCFVRSVMQLLSQHPKLHKLCLPCWRFAPGQSAQWNEFFANLSPSSFGELLEIKLENCGINNDTLNTVIVPLLQRSPKLRVLLLPKNRFDSVQQLATTISEYNQDLHILDCSDDAKAWGQRMLSDPAVAAFATMLKSPGCKLRKLSVPYCNFGTLGVRAFVDLFKGGWTPADKNSFTLDLDFHAGGRCIGLYLIALWSRAGLPKQQIKTRHNSISRWDEEDDVYRLGEIRLSDEAFLNRQEEFRRIANEETVHASKDLLSEEMFALQVKEYPELRQAARELGFLSEVKKAGRRGWWRIWTQAGGSSGRGRWGRLRISSAPQNVQSGKLLVDPRFGSRGKVIEHDTGLNSKAEEEHGKAKEEEDCEAMSLSVPEWQHPITDFFGVRSPTFWRCYVESVVGEEDREGSDTEEEEEEA